MDGTRSTKFTFASTGASGGGNNTVNLPPSLLDFVHRSYSRSAETLCTRVSIVGKITDKKHSEKIIEICKSIVCTEEENGRKMTGLLFTVGHRYFYLCSELSTLSGYKSLWKGLIQIENESENNMRVISVTETVRREFSFWRHFDITDQVPDIVTMDNSDRQTSNKDDQSQSEEEGQSKSKQSMNDIANEIWQTVRSVIEIGQQMSRKTDTESAIKLFESGQRDIVNRLPIPETMEHLLSLSMCPSISDYYHFVFSPLQFELESEHSWPTEPDFIALEKN